MDQSNIQGHDSTQSPWNQFGEGVGNVATGTYDFINEYNPLPAIDRIGSDAFQDIKNIDYTNYYASNEEDAMLRSAMQSPNLNPAVDTFNRAINNRAGWGNNWTDQPIFTDPMPTIAYTPLIDYNGLFFVILLLIVLILANYWKE